MILGTRTEQHEIAYVLNAGTCLHVWMSFCKPRVPCMVTRIIQRPISPLLYVYKLRSQTSRWWSRIHTIYLQLWARPNPLFLLLNRPTYLLYCLTLLQASLLACRKTLLPQTLSSKAKATGNSRSLLLSALLKQETYWSILILTRSIFHSISLRGLFDQHLLSMLIDLHQLSLLNRLSCSTIRILATTTRTLKNTDA